MSVDKEVQEFSNRLVSSTHELFASSYKSVPCSDDLSASIARRFKTKAEYGAVMHLTNPQATSRGKRKATQQQSSGIPFPTATSSSSSSSSSSTALVKSQAQGSGSSSTALIHQRLIDPTSTSALIQKKLQAEGVAPEWRAPWKLMRVISGHQGWVRAVAVDPSNEWFCTGSADRTIKIWDLASGTLKLSLTGHINCVRGLCVSDRHPYLFSCGDDKMVKCWDLEQNKIVRHYHGHLSGVYCIAMHPTLDLLVTGGRDSVARVWDIRTKAHIFTLNGHTNTVASVVTQGVDPQVITGGMDNLIKMWDLTTGKCSGTLTHHKKSIRTLALHPTMFCMASGASDHIKQWKFPEGRFLQNTDDTHAIVNTLSINADGVMAAGCDSGALHFFDWRSGHNFYTEQTRVQPGSLEAEAGIFCSAFDKSGSRLITGEADKTVKIWREDDSATPESHPLKWVPRKRGRI